MEGNSETIETINILLTTDRRNDIEITEGSCYYWNNRRRDDNWYTFIN